MLVYAVYPDHTTFENITKILPHHRWNNLLSYAYYTPERWDKIVLHSSNLLVDSGAFTYMNTHKTTKGIDKFFKQYLHFVKNKDETPHLTGFIEFDVGSLTNMDYVYNCREQLQSVSDKIIPVFHTYQGIQEFKQMVHDYNYIAIGGVVGSRKPDMVKLNEYARKHGTKVHMLGVTGETYLKKTHFYSCDSASYLQSKYGRYFKFNPMKCQMLPLDSKKLSENNLTVRTKNYLEFMKLQKYYYDYWYTRDPEWCI